MNTALICGPCGRQVGVAHRRPDDVVVVRLRNARRAGHQQVVFPSGRSSVLPLEWPCRRCGLVLRLDTEQVARVGVRRQLICDSMPTTT